jgi:hypothetical protein
MKFDRFRNKVILSNPNHNTSTSSLSKQTVFVKMNSSNYHSSKVNMGLILREKEKSIIDILARHPSLANRQTTIDSITKKIDLNLMLSSSMRSRTNRYENTDDGNDDFGQGGEHEDDMNYRSGMKSMNSEINHFNTIDMNTIMNQTLVDMEQLQAEKDQQIQDLQNQLTQKEKEIEEYQNRATTIKHYSNLLIRSSNLYVNKNPNEITESDKVLTSLNFPYLLLPWSDISFEAHFHSFSIS